MRNGIIRFIAAITLAVIIIPIILPMFINITEGMSEWDLMCAFVDAIPFGNVFASISIELFNSLVSGLNTFFEISGIDLGYYTKITLNINESNHLFAIEILKAFMVSVFWAPIEAITGFLTKTVNEGFFNRAANLIFQMLICFISILCVNFCFDLFQIKLISLPVFGQNAVLFLVILLVVGGGLFSFIVLLGSIVKAIIQFSLKVVLINLLKSSIIYVFCLTILMLFVYKINAVLDVFLLLVMILIWWLITIFENSIDTYIEEL